MRLKPRKVGHNRRVIPTSSVKAEEPKKEIPQSIVEEIEDEELENPDDGEGEG